MSKDFSNLLGGALTSKQADESSIRERITIREDFKALIPPLASDELEQLEQNILKEGVRDPLIIWPVDESFILVDGHNRFSVCQKHNLQFPFKKVAFKDDDEVRDWMIRNQLGRRNLTQEQQSYLRGLRYLQEKSQGKRTDLTSGQNVQKSESESTAERLAKEYNVSDKTIIRDAQFAEGLEIVGKENPDLKKEILLGTSKISKEEIRSLSKKSTSSKKPKAKKNQKSHSANDIAAIAFQYLHSETRTVKQVIDALGEKELDPLEFFLKWKNSQ